MLLEFCCLSEKSKVGGFVYFVFNACFVVLVHAKMLIVHEEVLLGLGLTFYAI